MTSPTTPASNAVPTISLVDSAGMQAFEDAMAKYYTPPVQPPIPFDPSGNTPDVILIENYDNAVRDQTSANTNAFMEYRSLIHNCAVFTPPAGTASIPFLPHPPQYKTVNFGRFTMLWNAWNAFVQRTLGDPAYMGFDAFQQHNPGLANYLDPVDPLPPPVVKVGIDAVTPPPPILNTDLVGSYLGSGVWAATPFAVASASMAFAPNNIVISDSRSSTGFFRYYTSPFMSNKGMWIPVSPAEAALLASSA